MEWFPLGDALHCCQQSQRDKLGALLAQLQYLAFIQLAAHCVLQKRLCRTPFRLPRLYAGLHASAKESAQVCLS